MKNSKTIVTTILLTLACFTLSQVAQARQQSEDRGNGNSAAEDVDALNLGTTGSNNTAHGWFSLFSNTSGAQNTANGFNALYQNTTGGGNTAMGYKALFANTTGGANTANGFFALLSNTDGSSNTAIGDVALANNTTGSFNVALGVGAGTGVITASNVICIGQEGQNLSNSCYIGNIFEASSGGTAVFINSDGRLGTITSSQRFKEQIEPMGRASEALLALKPVTFRYKKEIDPRGVSQFGLVAEDVEKTNPDLVVRDKEGKPYSVRYDQVNAMLLNEFLKEHRKVQKLEAELETVNKRLREQEAKMDKVSAHLEPNTPAPRMVVNDH